MSTTKTYEIVFPEWYDERGEWEAEAKGWLQGVEVRFPNGDFQSLFFYDPVRLAQDMEEEAKSAKPFIAAPGLVVIPSITRDTILKVVAKLVDEGYFPIRRGTEGCSLNDVIHDSAVGVSIR